MMKKKNDDGSSCCCCCYHSCGRRRKNTGASLLPIFVCDYVCTVGILLLQFVDYSRLYRYIYIYRISSLVYYRSCLLSMCSTTTSLLSPSLFLPSFFLAVLESITGRYTNDGSRMDICCQVIPVGRMLLSLSLLFSNAK